VVFIFNYYNQLIINLLYFFIGKLSLVLRDKEQGGDN